MRRILIIANTYYQMILAIQMKLTIFEEDDVVLLLSDHSQNADKISEKLKSEKVFLNVSYIKTNGIISDRNNKQRIEDFFNIITGGKNRYSFYLDDIVDYVFDELICFNYSIDIIGLFSLLYEKNSKIKISLYEEGVLSYDVKFEDNIRRKIIKRFRHFLKKGDISESFENFYCFYPQIYRGTLQTILVPRISYESKCADILRNIFNIEKEKLVYPQKYIYFTSVYDFEGGVSIGEFELVKRISCLVGQENLIVKVHPRDSRDVYQKAGLNVDRHSSVPWEAIQLSRDFSNKIFITATSGSVLSGSFMSEKPVKTFYLYKMCNIAENDSAKRTIKNIYNLLQSESVKAALENIKIAETLEEILE